MSLIKVKGSSITGALAAVDGSALTGVSGTYVKLEHKNVTSAASEIDFQQKFSSTYKNYFLLCLELFEFWEDFFVIPTSGVNSLLP